MGAPDSWFWGYDRMTTVDGLFTAGDGVGASGHKFSSGAHAEGRMAAKGALAFILDHKTDKLEAAQNIDEVIAEIYLPFEIFEKYKGYTTAPEINPNYLMPKQVQTRLQKLMDEYVAGCSTMYMCNKPSLDGRPEAPHPAEGRRQPVGRSGPARTDAGLGKLSPDPLR